MSVISAGNTVTTALTQTADTSGNLVFTTGGANTVALTLSNAQAVTFTGSVNIPNTFGFKNRLINGGMTIDQRNAGASGTSVSGSAQTVDRWGYYGTQASKITWQQNAGSVTPPAGFTNYLGFTSSSAYSVLSSDRFLAFQYIEGLNVADLAWGTANAKTVTLSFQVYSSLTGTFGGYIQNSAANRSYPFSYTISSANTWTPISITIAGDTTGTWLTTNGIGIVVGFSLGMGSTFSGAAGAWAGANYNSATGATSVVGTNGATFYITGVQLEVGSQATSFDFRDYGRELILCQRYYEKTYDQTVVSGTNTQVGACFFPYGGVNSFATFPFAVEKRTGPTMSIWDIAGNANKGTWVDGSANLTNNATQGVPVQQSGTRNVILRMSNGIVGTPVAIGYHWTASAEL